MVERKEEEGRALGRIWERPEAREGGVDKDGEREGCRAEIGWGWHGGGEKREREGASSG